MFMKNIEDKILEILKLSRDNGLDKEVIYKKLGYKLEFVRKDKDPKLSKYFYLKKINFSSGINGKETDIQKLVDNRE